MEVRVELPDDLPETLGCTREELSRDLRLHALTGLVERGLLSSGRAAELAGLSRRDLLDWCGRYDVRLHRWTEADVDAEIAFAKDRE